MYFLKGWKKKENDKCITEASLKI